MGDGVGAIYWLENIGNQTNCSFGLSGPDWLSEFANSIELSSVYIHSGEGGSLVKMQRHSGKGQHFLPRLLLALQRKYHFNISQFQPLTVRGRYDVKPNTVAVQFDGRTAKRRALLFYDPHNVVRTFAPGYSVVVVGGPGTKHYLDWEPLDYRISPLPSLVYNLLSCEFFLGCDSGMSILAGAVGMKTVVVSLLALSEYEHMCPVYETFVQSDFYPLSHAYYSLML